MKRIILAFALLGALLASFAAVRPALADTATITWSLPSDLPAGVTLRYVNVYCGRPTTGLEWFASIDETPNAAGVVATSFSFPVVVQTTCVTTFVEVEPDVDASLAETGYSEPITFTPLPISSPPLMTSTLLTQPARICTTSTKCMFTAPLDIPTSTRSPGG